MEVYMRYTIYKITNEVNGKIYIGKHQTKDLNDGYMGSGKHLKRAINKHGLENFTKEILFQFDNETDMNAKEAELVTEEFVKEDTNYNLCPGGHGGFGYINSTGLNTSGVVNRDYKEISKKVQETRMLRNYVVSDETRIKLSENNWSKNNPELHKKHVSGLHSGKQKSEEHKKKISEKLSGKKKETVMCPYCKIIGSKPIMSRWHFDKCKKKH